MTGLTRQVLQIALEVELADHLGYDKHDPVGRNGMNSRNGSTPKTARTEVCEVSVQIPKDRAGTFAPAVVPKYARRLAGFDEYVRLVRQAQASAHGLGMAFGLDAPWSLATTPYELGTALEALLPFVDSVAIVSYSDHSNGMDGIIAQAWTP